ncbi:hypothetical protein K440DRAFT_11140, partial [Wilcoxina mikolae CBS 423.85]
MDSLGELFSFSLARRKASEDAFWIHPVVHMWARERLDTHLKAQKTEEAVILCGRVLTQQSDKPPHRWAFERRIWLHIESVQRHLRTLPRLSNLLGGGEMLFNAASNMGQLYYNHGHYSQAIYLLEWALAGLEHFLGEEHASTLSTTDSMAGAFHKQGQYEKALEWYRRALEGREKTLGKDHPDTLLTVHNMAWVFLQQMQYEKALEWCRRALDGREKTLGKDHPDTLD